MQIKKLNLPKLKTVGNGFLYHNRGLVTAEFSALETVGG